MDKLYQLLISDDKTSINVNTIDPSEITRLLTLAGMEPSPSANAAPTPPVPELPPPDRHMHHCAICGADDHDEEDCPDSISADDMMDDHELEEDQAEYDYGDQDVDPEGHELDADSYVWQGAKLPQRIVKGTQGDNPLISELHREITALYKEYLAEEERENEDGMMSPLSDPTKPEFDKDPLAGEEPVDDGSHSPLSTIERQPTFK